MNDEPSRHPFVWLVYAALFALTIPWYFTPGASAPTWLGFPRWVTVSLLATLGIALFTLYVIDRFWDEEGP